jgi:hypothetical protein
MIVVEFALREAEFIQFSARSHDQLKAHVLRYHHLLPWEIARPHKTSMSSFLYISL